MREPGKLARIRAAWQLASVLKTSRADGQEPREACRYSTDEHWATVSAGLATTSKTADRLYAESVSANAPAGLADSINFTQAVVEGWIRILGSRPDVGTPRISTAENLVDKYSLESPETWMFGVVDITRTSKANKGAATKTTDLLAERLSAIDAESQPELVSLLTQTDAIQKAAEELQRRTSLVTIGHAVTAFAESTYLAAGVVSPTGFRSTLEFIGHDFTHALDDLAKIESGDPGAEWAYNEILDFQKAEVMQTTAQEVVDTYRALARSPLTYLMTKTPRGLT